MSRSESWRSSPCPARVAVGCAASEPSGDLGRRGPARRAPAGTRRHDGRGGHLGHRRHDGPGRFGRNRGDDRPGRTTGRRDDRRRDDRHRGHDRQRRARRAPAGRGHGGPRWLGRSARRAAAASRRRQRRDDGERRLRRHRRLDGPNAERRLRQVRSAVGRHGPGRRTVTLQLPHQLRRHEAVPAADRVARLRQPEHRVREPDEQHRLRDRLRPVVPEHARQRPVLEQLHRRRRPDPPSSTTTWWPTTASTRTACSPSPTARARRCWSTSWPTRPTRST